MIMKATRNYEHLQSSGAAGQVAAASIPMRRICAMISPRRVRPPGA
jgi:hypothetical protein